MSGVALFFYDGRDPRAALGVSFNPGIIFLSFVIATLTSYAFFSIAERVNVAGKRSYRNIFLGALTMGTGLWATHFIGMIALRLPIPTQFDFLLTLLSTVPVIISSAVLIYYFVQQKIENIELLFCAILMSGGIGAMNYIGMLAMRGVKSDLVMLVEPKHLIIYYLASSLLFFSALRVNFMVWGRIEKSWSAWGRFDGAYIMGLAVTATHYMHVTSYYFFKGNDSHGDSAFMLDTISLTIWVSFASFLLALLTIFLAFVDHRIQEASNAEQASREQLRDAIESIADAFSLYDDEDRLVICNERYRDLIEVKGYSLRRGALFESIMRNAADSGVITEAQGRIEDWLKWRMARHREPGEPFVEQWRDNRWFRVSEHKVPTGGTVAIRTEISDLKRTEIELSKAVAEAEKARAAAEEATKTKSAFLANMSHELRTPMNAIIGYCEILIEEAEEAEDRSYLADLKKIRSAGKHLLALIDDVLDFSKIEAGKMPVHIQAFELSLMLQEVASTVAPLAEKNDNRLVIETGDDLGVMCADSTKVRQTLLNLLSNACKFTRSGLVKLTAKRETLGGNDWLQFSVTDTGVGISPEQMKKLFKAFSQADASTTILYGGSGLGLILSRRYCQMMGGDITVESTLGAGSTFTIHLPAGGTALDKAPALASSEPPAERVPPRQGTPTVLVVDAERLGREAMQLFLSQQGFRMAEAAAGEDDLELVRDSHPEVILLHVNPPKMNELRLLEAIKSSPELTSIPVIIAMVVDDDNKGTAMGDSHYLTKPINRRHLSQILAKYHSPARPHDTCSALFA